MLFLRASFSALHHLVDRYLMLCPDLPLGIEVKDLNEQRLHLLRVEGDQQLDVGLVEPVEVLQPADQVQVGAARLAPRGAGRVQVALKEVVVGLLKSNVCISTSFSSTSKQAHSRHFFRVHRSPLVMHQEVAGYVDLEQIAFG